MAEELMGDTIEHHSDAVAEEILALPDSLAAQYVLLARRIVAAGPDLG